MCLSKMESTEAKARKLEKVLGYLKHETHKLRLKTYKILRRMNTNLPKVSAAEALDYFINDFSK